MEQVEVTDNGHMDVGKKPSRHRVLFILPQPFFLVRGSSMRAQSTVQALAELGHEVDLLTLAPGQDIEIPGVTAHRCWPLPFIKEIPIGPSWVKLLYDVSLFGKAWSLSSGKKYTLVHGVEEAAFMAARVARRLKVPFVFDMHSLMSEQLENGTFLRSQKILHVFKKIEKEHIQRCSGVVTVGPDIGAKVNKINPSIPVCSLPDLPLKDEHSFDPMGVSSLKQQFALNNKKVAVYTGNFEEYQGMDLLLDSWALVKQENPQLSEQWKLLLVGGGDQNAPRRQLYQRKAEALGIAEQVIFAGEFSPDLMGNFYELADLLLSPRASGGNTPLKIYSYMQAMKPIVVTRISSHTQVLDENSSYLASTEAKDFARALKEVFDDINSNSERLQSRVHKAKEVLDQQFSRKQFQGKLQKLYDELPQAA